MLKMLNQRWKLLLGLVLVVGVGIWFGGSAQECTTAIRSDLYFQPATEMAGEKTFPEVVILQNAEIALWAVPNRGRLIFDVIRKETGHSQLVTTRTPLPVRFRGVYTFEFGGMYSTFPWHKRDHQPLLLEMELFNDEVCGLRMWSNDPETDVMLIVELHLPRSGAELRVILSLVNPRPMDRSIDFGIVLVARPGGKMSSNTELFIPVGSVVLGESEGNWMGDPGRVVSWPAPWHKWKEFVKSGTFYFLLPPGIPPFVAVYNPDTDEALRLRGRPGDPWTRCEIFSWGLTHTEVMGAYDGFRIELKAEKLTIPGTGVKTLEILISADRGRPFDGHLDH
ncbi:MAG: hypothetical protein QXU26_03380 [Thermofilaceae archaeon]